MENKRYIVSFRQPGKPSHEVVAATVKREGGRLIFTNIAGEETGNFTDADVLGNSIKPVDDEEDMPPIGGMA